MSALHLACCLDAVSVPTVSALLKVGVCLCGVRCPLAVPSGVCVSLWCRHVALDPVWAISGRVCCRVCCVLKIVCPSSATVIPHGCQYPCDLNIAGAGGCVCARVCHARRVPSPTSAALAMPALQSTSYWRSTAGQRRPQGRGQPLGLPAPPLRTRQPSRRPWLLPWALCCPTAAGSTWRTPGASLGRRLLRPVACGPLGRPLPAMRPSQPRPLGCRPLVRGSCPWWAWG
jgi:hypothetical protein